MHAFALAGFAVAALACNSSSRGRLRPPISPEAPIRSACRRVMPSQVLRKGWPKGMNMIRPPEVREAWATVGRRRVVGHG